MFLTNELNSKDVNEMNDEELVNYVTELLDNQGIKLYNYEVSKDDDNTITKTHFISNQGWEIEKKDVWYE